MTTRIIRRIPLLTVLGALVLAPGCPGNPVTIGFQLSWQFRSDGALRTVPMGNMTVVVSPVNGDPITTATNLSGQGQVTFTSNPGQVKLIVKTENPRLAFFETCSSTQPNNYQYTIVPGSSPPTKPWPLNFGQHPEAGLWNTLTEHALSSLDTLTTFKMPYVKTCFGPDNLWKSREEYLQIRSVDASEPDIVNHEYGHAVMQKASGQILALTGCQPHGMRRVESPSCAWVEGWANFFALFARYGRDAAAPVIFKMDGNMEDYYSPAVGLDGYKDEGRVAAALWDLYDVHNDSNWQATFGQQPFTDSNANNPVSMTTMLEALNGADVDTSSGTIRLFIQRLLLCSNGVSCPPVDRSTTVATANFNWLLRP